MNSKRDKVCTTRLPLMTFKLPEVVFFTPKRLWIFQYFSSTPSFYSPRIHLGTSTSYLRVGLIVAFVTTLYVCVPVKTGTFMYASVVSRLKRIIRLHCCPFCWFFDCQLIPWITYFEKLYKSFDLIRDSFGYSLNLCF